MKNWLVGTALILAGCFPLAPTVIVDLDRDKVVVQGDAGTEFEEIATQAKEGCALHRRKAVAISESCAGGQRCYTNCSTYGGCYTNCSEDCDIKHHLFACTE